VRRRPARVRDRRRRHEPRGARARGGRGDAAGRGGRMSCAFDLAHYREVLEAAKSGGYTFACFDADPRPGDLLLRHDVDLSLEAALRLAELEAAEDVQATYFLMTQSVFYNLASEPGEGALDQLRELGHRVGLHAVWPRAELDARFDPVVAWHNPDPEYMRDAVDGAVNVMQAPWADVYRSHSHQHCRQGCPHERLAAGHLEPLTH